MKTDSAVIPLIALLVVVVCAGCDLHNPASQKEAAKTVYPIKLTRSEKVGDKYHLQARGVRSLYDQASAQGKIVGRTNLLTVDLDANVQVLEVDAKGQEEKLSLTVLKCTAATNGIPKSLFTNGAIIIARQHNGNDTFEVDGKAVAAKAADALQTVISLGGFAGDDDASFGTATPRAPGESWPIASSALLSGAKTSDAPFEPKDLTGQTQLSAVTQIEGVPCLDIVANATSTNFTMPKKAGLSVREGRLEINYEGFFPTNTSERLLKESFSAKFSLQADQQGPKGLISRNVMFEQSTERQLGR